MPIPLCTCGFSRAPHFVPLLLLVGVMTLVLIFRKSFEISCLFIIGRIIIHHCLEAMRKTKALASILPTVIWKTHESLLGPHVFVHASIAAPHRQMLWRARWGVPVHHLYPYIRCPGTSFVSLHQVPSVYRVLLSCSYRVFRNRRRQ